MSNVLNPKSLKMPFSILPSTNYHPSKVDDIAKNKSFGCLFLDEDLIFSACFLLQLSFASVIIPNHCGYAEGSGLVFWNDLSTSSSSSPISHALISTT